MLSVCLQRLFCWMGASILLTGSALSMPNPLVYQDQRSDLVNARDHTGRHDCPPYSPPVDGRLANTTSGLFQGIHQGRNYNITAFLSIPYAAAPVDNLRFAAPHPYLPIPESYETAIMANKTPNACHQLPYHTLLESKRWPMPESEDCLTVSIWRASSETTVPRGDDPSPLKPVLIFVHGGGFTEGGTAPLFGHAILNDHPDLIVVGINYRLNIFGFPNPGSLNDASVTPNAALHDQRLAIEWLHGNIASFGGDPARMVAMGHSAGSQSLGHYAFAHADDPLVSGMILWSGMPEGGLQDRTGEGWRQAVQRTGCAADANSENSGEEEIACLRGLDARDLLQKGVSYSLTLTYDSFTEDGWTPGVPSPDNLTNWDAVSGAYIEKALQGQAANIPTWIQTTTHEADNTVTFDTTQPWAYDNGIGAINRTEADLNTLFAFHCPAWLGAQTRLFGAQARNISDKGMGKIYRSLYNASFPAQHPFPWMQDRPFHGEDVMLLFGDLDDPAAWWGPVTGEMRAAARYLRGAVAAFVRDPEGGLEGELGWKAYGNGGHDGIMQLLLNGNEAKVEFMNAMEYDAPCREIWKDVFPAEDL